MIFDVWTECCNVKKYENELSKYNVKFTESETTHVTSATIEINTLEELLSLKDKLVYSLTIGDFQNRHDITIEDD